MLSDHIESLFDGLRSSRWSLVVGRQDLLLGRQDILLGQEHILLDQQVIFLDQQDILVDQWYRHDVDMISTCRQCESICDFPPVPVEKFEQMRARRPLWSTFGRRYR